MTPIRTATVDLDREDDLTLVDGADVTLVSVGDVTGASALREQDDVVHDPNDPNLGTNPEREYKLYFTAVISGVSFIWVIFSADAATWGSPVECQMGAANAGCEDPSVLTLMATRGQVYRDGSNKMYLYCEDHTADDIYGYESTDGITFTELSGNPVIARGGSGTWDQQLVGSPVARHDGTNFLIGYEGIWNGGGTERFGVAHGITPNGLSKLAANPVWNTTDPIVSDSIVVDSFFLNTAGDAIVLLAHDGIGNGTATMYRGLTAELDPTAWEDGDIVGIGTGNVSTIRNDFTLDNSSGLARAVTAPADDQSLVSKAASAEIGAKIPTIKIRESGVFTSYPLRYKVAGAFNSDPAGDPPAAGLGLHLKANALTGLSDGDPVSTWTATVGASPTQSGANRPTYKTNIINGLPVLRFNGSSQWLRFLTGLGLTRNRAGLTVFVVAASDTVTVGSRFMFFVGHGSSFDTTARLAFEANRGTGANLGAGGRRLDGNSFQHIQAASAVSTGVFFQAAAKFDYANSDLFLYKNGTQVASSTSFQTAGNTSDTDSLGMAVGAITDGSSEWWDGDIAEILVYTSALDDTTRGEVETYLSSKYAI